MVGKIAQHMIKPLLYGLQFLFNHLSSFELFQCQLEAAYHSSVSISSLENNLTIASNKLTKNTAN